ncbi:contractile injection system tape measure protein [Pedobacter nyackensis]|uniref:contractile injection system tape measure protein n=1 Tax=Pedobacter nyackensis TaxID=475255 RepID=UPI00292D0598|nr:contractile injection system tape measure protein [Pedobacter nyackensis]
MKSQYYSIQQLKFDVGFFSKEMAHELQNRLSRLHHQQVQRVLRDFFQRNIPENLLIRKDSLVLDLGNIPYERLENELPERLEEALEELFAPLLTAKDNLQWNNLDFEHLPTEKGYLSILEFYLIHGTLPWQAASQHGLTWKNVLHLLYQHDRDQLRNSLLRLGRQQNIRKRLAFQSSEQDIEKIIITIIPNEATIIFSYKKNIEKVQHQRQLVKSDAGGFTQAISFFILTYLLEERRSLFSQKTFIKSLLDQMAAHYNVSYLSLLDILHDSLPVYSYSASTGSTLFELINELKLESHAPLKLNNSTAPVTEPGLTLNEKAELLQYYLNEGSLSSKWATLDISKEKLATYFNETIEKTPSTIRKTIFSLTPGTSSVQRITDLLPVNELTGFIGCLWTNEANFIIEYLHLLIRTNAGGALGMIAGNSFGVLLRKMMIQYIFSTGSSSIKKSDFIQFSLQFLSNQRNVTIPALLNAFISTADTPGLKDHMQIFKSLIKSPFPAPEPAEANAFLKSNTGTDKEEIKQTISPQNTLVNLLHYYLQYGNLPWWSKEHQHHSPEALFKMLLKQSVSEALILIEKAGKQPATRRRFLWQFSEDLIYTVFSYFPDWDFVTMAIEVVIELIESISVLSKITQLSLKHIVMEAVWLSYLEMRYEAFSERHFYLNIFNSLSSSQNIEIVTLRRLFVETMEVHASFSSTTGNSDPRDIILSKIKQLLILSDTEVQHIAAPPTKNRIEVSRYVTFDTFLLHQQEQSLPLNTKQRQERALYFLEYYLTWNRLPENSPALSHGELENMLTELLLFLYMEDREALKRILRSEKHSVNARMQVHGLFLPDHKGGDYKQLSQLLEDYIEKDALQYVKEVFGNGSVIGNEALKPVLDRLLEKARSGDTEEQFKLLLKSAALTKYMASNYGNETMEWLIEQRAGSSATFSHQTALIRKLILSIAPNTNEYQRIRILLNEAALFYFSGTEHARNLNSYISFTFHYLTRSFYTAAFADFFRILLNKIQTSTNFLPVYNDILLPVKYELESQLRIQERELFLKKKATAELKDRELLAKLAEKKLKEEQYKQQQEEQSKKKMAQLLKKGDKLYVGNAGLVLLHPFLGTYFTRLNLIEKGQFTDLEARGRAVHLLQYLAFKTSENPEHELVLNKILCNYPLHEPLPLEITMTTEEINLSAELLQVVIQRAGKLSASSEDGFRVSFLQRDGVITETAEEWTLRVDQRGYDLILQTLPWAFGMIKFQWMDKPMITEWI